MSDSASPPDPGEMVDAAGAPGLDRASSDVRTGRPGAIGTHTSSEPTAVQTGRPSNRPRIGVDPGRRRTPVHRGRGRSLVPARRRRTPTRRRLANGSGHLLRSVGVAVRRPARARPEGESARSVSNHRRIAAMTTMYSTACDRPTGLPSPVHLAGASGVLREGRVEYAGLGPRNE